MSAFHHVAALGGCLVGVLLLVAGANAADKSLAVAIPVGILGLEIWAGSFVIADRLRGKRVLQCILLVLLAYPLGLALFLSLYVFALTPDVVHTIVMYAALLANAIGFRYWKKHRAPSTGPLHQ
ncbi:MAG: hypothetical protein HY234_12955 [Acidobacteria bacterium]|nr:hypothetical protein [Acidobacteriota bacterium]